VGRVLAALLAAVFVVQSGAIHSEGTSMSTGAELSAQGSDFPDFQELGEGAAGPGESDDSAKTAVKETVEDEQQKELGAIEKLMEQPIVDPRQAKMQVLVDAKMKKAIKRVKEDLSDVVQMKMLVQRVNEAQAKKAEGVEPDLENWAILAGEQVEDDGTMKGGAICMDDHPGLCQSISSSGHCAIKAYSVACPLSCHMCAMPATFRLGLNGEEKTEKQAEERAGKAEAAKMHEAFQKKESVLRAKLDKRRAKLKVAEHRSEKGQKTVEAMLQEKENAKTASERQAKGAQNKIEKAKARAKSAKEQLKKDKEKPKLAKPSDMAVKGAQSEEKETGKKVAERKKELKRLREKKKKDNKRLTEMEKKQGGAEGVLEKVFKEKGELAQKKEEGEKEMALALKLAGKEGDKMRSLIEASGQKKKEVDSQMKKKKAMVKRELDNTLKQEVVLMGSREEAEILSKKEQKRIQEFTIPEGEERKVKMELEKADRDVSDMRQKFRMDKLKYTDLGLKWVIPATMEHLYAKAKQAKAILEDKITKLDSLSLGPAVQKLQMEEVESKEIMSQDEEKYRGLKKLAVIENKQLKDLNEKEKKRRDEVKKQLGTSQKTAEKLMKDAKDKEKKDTEGIAKSTKKLVADEAKATKDLEVSKPQVAAAEADVTRARKQTKSEKKALRNAIRRDSKAKGKIQKEKANLVQAKAKAKTDQKTAVEQQKGRITKETAAVEQSKVKIKGAQAKLKEIKKEMKDAGKVDKKLKKSQKKVKKDMDKEVKLFQKAEEARAALRNIDDAEPGKEKAALTEGEAKAEEKAEAKKEEKAEKKKEEKAGEEKADAAAKKAGLSGKAEAAAKEKGKGTVDEATAKVKEGEKAKVEKAEEAAAKKTEGAGGVVDKAVEKAEKKAEDQAKENGDDPKEAKKEAKKEVLDAVEQAKEAAEEEGEQEEKDAERTAANVEAAQVASTVSNLVITAATKEAIADALPLKKVNPKPAASNPNVFKQDESPALCEIIKKQGHCSNAKYVEYCAASCNPAVPATHVEKSDPKKRADEEAEATDGDDKKDEPEGDSELADSQEDSISQLEAELGASIKKANKAISHAHNTEDVSDKDIQELSDDSD